jgi:type IV pilus assembly protein PilF
MRMNRTIRLALRGLALPAAAALMLGCASQGGPGAPAMQEPAREVRTASDQTDADRRSRVRLELAAGYFGRGQAETALDEVKLALAANPNNGDAFNLRGLIYASLNEDRLAEESFRRALQINARDGGAMQNYGWFLCQRRRYDESFTQFQQAVALPQYAGAPQSLMTLGICQARANRWAEAERSLSRSYELDPGSPVTAVNLAEVLYRRGELERARFYIRRVNSLNDVSNAQTLWLAARIEHKIGNLGGAREYGEQLRNRFPQSQEALMFDKGRFDDQ